MNNTFQVLINWDKGQGWTRVHGAEYYEALNSARNGSSKDLNAIFTALIKE